MAERKSGSKSQDKRASKAPASRAFGTLRDTLSMRWEPASEPDAELTLNLLRDPIFHGGHDQAEAVAQAATACSILASVGGRSWRLNAVVVVAAAGGGSPSKLAICMHGHGHACCIASWGRFWGPLRAQGYTIVAFDAPGFGRSEGASGQTMAWRDFGGDLVLQIADSFSALGSGRVTVLGQCMGGAMFLRALQRSPDTFAPYHLLHNCTIGTWPEDLPQILRRKGGGVQSFWWYDPDHLREANVYREFTKMMTTTPELCTFVDLQRDCDLPAFFDFGRVPEPRLARSEIGLVLGYCGEAVKNLVGYLGQTARPPKGSGPSAPKQTALELGLDNQDFKVFVRVRPPLPREFGQPACCSINDVEDPKQRLVQQILLHRDDAARGQANAEFIFERIFTSEASQEDVWNTLHAKLDVVGALLSDVGATVFAYGQTGSGKTHTIDGGGTGLVARIVRDLYARKPETHRIGCRYAQLYNEDFLDLFAPPTRLSQDGMGNILGGETLCLETSEELLRAIEAGSAVRTSSKTNMNDASSRSHAILSLSLCPVSLENAGDTKSRPQLFIVDLAGSERVKRSGAQGTQLAEAVAINQSLLALCNVTSALVEDKGKPRSYIPYRDSALTMMLKNSLGGNARTALIACISPTIDSFDETHGTLRFAACATHVQNRTSSQKEKAKSAEEDEGLDEALLERSVDFSTGEAFIPTCAGSVHVLGNVAPAEAPVVVLIHHFDRANASNENWKSFLEALSAANVRYLIPSMPGHGKSQGESSSKPEEYAKDGGPTDVIRDILNECGVKKVVIGGYDWGGGVASAFAIKFPARARKLFVWCPSVRDLQEAESALQRRGKRGEVMLLWAKNDQWHPYPKGQTLANALGVKITEVRVRIKGGGDDALAALLRFMAS